MPGNKLHMVDLSKIYLYRMTHIDNIPHILKYGITHILSTDANKHYVAIGDNSIVDYRNNLLMPNGKVLGQYIPFYFGVRMPMLYVVQKGFNSVASTPTEKIVYCITSVQQILNHQLPFVFTNGHAVDGFTDFFDETYINQIEDIIDKNAINAKYWKNDKDLDLKRRKEAEFLIEKDIPTTAIVYWIVFNEQAKSTLRRIGIDEGGIFVKPGSYF